MARLQILVLMRNRRWAVVHAATQAEDSLHERRADAVTRAREIAAPDDAEVVVFGLDGRPQPRSE